MLKISVLIATLVFYHSVAYSSSMPPAHFKPDAENYTSIFLAKLIKATWREEGADYIFMPSKYIKTNQGDELSGIDVYLSHARHRGGLVIGGEYAVFWDSSSKEAHVLLHFTSLNDGESKTEWVENMQPFRLRVNDDIKRVVLEILGYGSEDLYGIKVLWDWSDIERIIDGKLN